MRVAVRNCPTFGHGRANESWQSNFLQTHELSLRFWWCKNCCEDCDFVKVDLETEIMKSLTDIDEDLTLQIQDNMFVENLSWLITVQYR